MKKVARKSGSLKNLFRGGATEVDHEKADKEAIDLMNASERQSARDELGCSQSTDTSSDWSADPHDANAGDSGSSCLIEDEDDEVDSDDDAIFPSIAEVNSKAHKESSFPKSRRSKNPMLFEENVIDEKEVVSKATAKGKGAKKKIKAKAKLTNKKSKKKKSPKDTQEDVTSEKVSATEKMEDVPEFKAKKKEQKKHLATESKHSTKSKTKKQRKKGSKSKGSTTTDDESALHGSLSSLGSLGGDSFEITKESLSSIFGDGMFSPSARKTTSKEERLLAMITELEAAVERLEIEKEEFLKSQEDISLQLQQEIAENIEKDDVIRQLRKQVHEADSHCLEAMGDATRDEYKTIALEQENNALRNELQQLRDSKEQDQEVFHQLAEAEHTILQRDAALNELEAENAKLRKSVESQKLLISFLMGHISESKATEGPHQPTATATMIPISSLDAAFDGAKECTSPPLQSPPASTKFQFAQSSRVTSPGFQRSNSHRNLGNDDNGDDFEREKSRTEKSGGGFRRFARRKSFNGL